MAKKVKALHALNWVRGNICTRRCDDDVDKQRQCYERMRKIIKGREDYLITHAMFLKVMQEKHKALCATAMHPQKSHRSWFFDDCPLCNLLMKKK